MHRSSYRSPVKTDGKVRSELVVAGQPGLYPSWARAYKRTRKRQERRRVKDMIRSGDYE